VHLQTLTRARLLPTVFIAVLALAALPGAVAADDPQYVYFFGDGNCLSQGGEIEVAADVPIILRFGWGAKTKGLVIDYINGTDQTLTIDEQQQPNVDSYWGSPFFVPASPPTPAHWRAWVSFPLGSLASGESTEVAYNAYVHHRLHDGFSYFGEHHPSFFGPGWFFEEPPLCTITAA